MTFQSAPTSLGSSAWPWLHSGLPPGGTCGSSGGCGSGGSGGSPRLTLARMLGGLVALMAALFLFRSTGGLSCYLPSGGGDGGPLIPHAPAVELVIAHYSSSLDWVPAVLASLGAEANLTLYSKGDTPPPGSIQLPNVGREAHTFLHHLHTRYHSLADVTLFVMGSAQLSRGKQRDLRELQSNWHKARRQGFYCSGLDKHAPQWAFHLKRWTGTTEDASAGGKPSKQRETGALLGPADPRPYGAWFAEYIGGPLPRAWCPGGFMAVSRNTAQRRPRSFYATLLAQLDTSPAPEAGHYMERSWASIFFHPAALPCCSA